MPISRFASIILPNRSTNLLQGFHSYRRFQCRGYCEAPKCNRKITTQNVVPEKPSDVRSRSWSWVIVPAGLLMIAGVGTVVHYNDERRAVPKGQGNERAKNTIYGPKFGGPFTLFDTEHHLVTERNLLGNWVLLYFGYTSSPDVGPEEVQKMAKVIKTLDSKQNVNLIPIFVTLDPQRDSLSQLRAYLKEFDHRIVGLTGPITAVRQMAQEYRVYFKKVEEDGSDYLIDSSHKMYLLQPNMEIVRCFGVEYGAEQLSEEILMEMSKSTK
ncbi:hypothetical protein IFM89_022035 [Coptis chinensis]|uniref:Protein SCO1 homolog 2, mitochondrial n=1 Tax=Coptis chinensis TaxID=261450 RepID=A0A835I2B1_9MAGN|nr:hypothetical protein IFM89_022035 [Coptis chinensis]